MRKLALVVAVVGSLFVSMRADHDAYTAPQHCEVLKYRDGRTSTVELCNFDGGRTERISNG